MKTSVHIATESFFSRYPKKHLKKGVVLLFPDEEIKNVHYIINGKIRQYAIDNRGNENVVNVFQSPAFFPVMSALHPLMHNRYFFEAATDVDLFVAPASDTVTLLRSQPYVMLDLLTRLYSGVEGMQRRMLLLMSGSAKDRTIFELVIESRRFGTQRDDGSFLIHISEGELARRAGLTRETTNRELSKLKQRGLIAITNQTITIKNVPTLERLLD